MICVLQPVTAAGDFAKQRASDALWVTKNTAKGFITTRRPLLQSGTILCSQFTTGVYV